MLVTYPKVDFFFFFFCLLGLELQKAGERAQVAVVPVQAFHHDEAPLVQNVPLEPLVLLRDLLRHETKQERPRTRARAREYGTDTPIETRTHDGHFVIGLSTLIYHIRYPPTYLELFRCCARTPGTCCCCAGYLSIICISPIFRDFDLFRRVETLKGISWHTFSSWWAGCESVTQVTFAKYW